MRKHPRVISGGKTINMADLEADWLVMLQHRHYNLFFLGFAIILPTLLPCILWGEALSTAYFVTGRRIQLPVTSVTSMLAIKVTLSPLTSN